MPSESFSFTPIFEGIALVQFLGQDAEIKLYEYETDISGFSKLAYENVVTCLKDYVTYLYGTWVIFVSKLKKSLWP